MARGGYQKTAPPKRINSQPILSTSSKRHTHTLLTHHIDITSTFPGLLLPRFPRRRSTNKIVNAAGIAHARSRPARRSTRGARCALVRDRPRHGRGDAEAILTKRLPESRRSTHSTRCAERSSRRRGEATYASRGGARWRRRSRHARGRRGVGRTRGPPGRGRRSLLGLGGFRSGLLVDPSLEVGIVDEATLLSEIGLDGLVGLLRRCLLLSASKPAAESPALLGRLFLCCTFRCSTVSLLEI